MERITPRAVGNREDVRAIDKWAPVIEVAVAFLLVEGALWTRGWTQVTWAMVAAGWIMYFTLNSGRNVHELGVGTRNLRQAIWIIPAVLVVAAWMITAAALAGTFHGLTGKFAPGWHSTLYCVWAMVQEFMVQSFIFVRLESVLNSEKKAVVGTALLFAAAHVPSGVLISGTLVAGLVLTELFRRYRNVYPLGVAHAILGLALAMSLPDPVTHHMRVGIAYWH